ncbi:MAG: hypothetical protein H0V66_11185, partial [Bdellovibrionales bacterium]|nr:hypothetical protein [Bdellovibrionales bacterium]
MHSPCETSDLLVFSHLRWDFVYQRPQHLLSRHAKHRRVYYVEEPLIGLTTEAHLHIKETEENVKLVIPYLPEGMNEISIEESVMEMMEDLIQEEEINNFT